MKRSRPLSIRDQRAAKARRSGMVKIAFVAVAVLALGSAYAYIALSRRTLDPQTLCPAKLASVTVLLVDVTDPMNPAQRQDFLNQLDRLKNRIPRYGQLIIAKVDPTADRLLAPVMTRCNPGTAEDVDDMTGNPAALQRQWEQNFDAPLRRTFADLLNGSGAGASPILESIQSVNLTELQKPAVQGIPRALIVASDLLQNTGELSFYRTVPEAQIVIGSDAFRRARTDLRGIDVELWMLQRPDARQTQPRALPDLWERLIDAEGAELRRIYTVSG